MRKVKESSITKLYNFSRNDQLTYMRIRTFIVQVTFLLFHLLYTIFFVKLVSRREYYHKLFQNYTDFLL